MSRRQIVAAAALATVTALAALPGCGGAGKQLPGDRIPGPALTIYASLPRNGPSRASAEAIINGATMALSQAGRGLGKYRIRLAVLDDSTPQRGGWDPGQTTKNAIAAARDSTAIGYIGEFDSGASAISIPILNRAGIPQISPASTAVGLTSGGAGSSPGEPQKYYPTGQRTFARIVPNDSIQAAVQIRLQRASRCRSTYVLDDGQVDGEDTATSFQVAAGTAGLQIAGPQEFDRAASDYRSLASAVAQTGANCVLVSADTDYGAVLLTRQVAAALPSARIFGSAGTAHGTYADAARGGIPATLDSRVLITAATLGEAGYPPSGRAFFAAYAQRFGRSQPYAIYGYEAMRLLLSAVDIATHHGIRQARRSKVLSAIFATRDRRSVLGTYSIKRDGDTTLRRYGVYRVVRGRLQFWQAISA